MTRAKALLQPHLLTGSDLERLQVPSDHLSTWLADGSLEPVGTLPGDASSAGDPVFAVTTNTLRQDLALRLLEIDKPVVVMTPPRVRSLLQRFADPARPFDEAAQEEALAAVVAEVQADVGELMQFAVQTSSGDAPPADDAVAEPEPEPEQEQELDAEEDDGASCFDAGDLERALAALEPSTSRPRADAATAQPTTAENEPTMATESASAELLPESEVRELPPRILPTPDAADVVLAATIGRVDAFLERLQRSLLDLANKPAPPASPAAPPPATDVTPIAQAVQAGVERMAQAAATTHGALTALGERVGGIGAQIAAGLDKTLRAALAAKEPSARAPTLPVSVTPPPVAAPVAPTITLPRQDRMPAALLALATTVLAWSLLLWWKTGSDQLAVGTLVGANLIGCCLLAARRTGA